MLFLLLIINSLIIGIAVLIHFEALNLLSLLLPRLKVKHRSRVLFGVFGALLAHIIEIWLFAFAYYFKIHSNYFGKLEGRFDNSLMDCSYFSFTAYTSLGFGSMEPIGDIRFLAGLEALTGLLLITWTASFIFLEMQKSWKTA
jgi:hypothetical protein